MAVGNLEFIKSASGTSVSSLDTTDCFSADYDVYLITIKSDGSADTEMRFRFLDSTNTVISSASYDYASLNLFSNTAFTENRSTNQTYIDRIVSPRSATNGSGSVNVYAFNPYDSASYQFLTYQGTAQSTTATIGRKGIGVLKSAEQCNGFQIFPQTGTFDSINVFVYGLASN